ncbi:MAG: DUF5683 domain-containing protein [Bacteroidota bacterium]
MSIRLLALLLFLIGGLTLHAQIPDSLLPAPARKPAPIPKPIPAPEVVAPTPDLKLPTPKVRTYVPRTALMWAIIPGGGQVYNRRWWKVPLVFSAFTGVAATIDFNQGNYERFRDAYVLELAGKPQEFEDRFTADALRSLRDGFNKNRQTAYFALVAIYLLQGVEAYVDTHLRNFDMDEDLSQWQIMPQLIPDPTGQGMGRIALSLNYSF